MKKLLIIISILLFSASLFAQDNIEKKYTSKVGITFSSLGNDKIPHLKDLLADASFKTKDFYSFGLNFTVGLNKYKWVEIETGVEYAKHNITVSTITPTIAEHKTNFAIVNVPVTARINFLKYFFVNGGFLFDAVISSDSPISKKTGIGAVVGAAAKYDFDFNISVFLNPYIKYHSLVSFSDHNNEKITV
jgi:hypothetical protein